MTATVIPIAGPQGSGREFDAAVIRAVSDAPGPAALVSLPGWRVVHANKRLAEVLERPSGEIVGSSALEQVFVAAEADVATVARLVASGELEQVRIRRPLRVGRGRLVPAELDLRGAPGSPGRGLILGVRRSQHPAASPEPDDGAAEPAVAVVDSALRLRSATASLLHRLGWKVPPPSGRPDWVHHEDREALAGAVLLAVRRQVVPVAVRVRAGDAWVPLRATASALVDAGGREPLVMLTVEGDQPRRHHHPSTGALGVSEGERALQARVIDLESRLRRIAAEAAVDEPPAGRSGRPSRSELDELVAQHALSPREAEIVRLIVDGRRVPAIARQLFLSPSTVRNHLSAVYRKLGVSSQVELLELVHGAH